MDYLELSRMIYLENQDVCIPATYEGAPKICYHCRVAGHERKDCPDLAYIQCFKFKGYGRLRRHCTATKRNPDTVMDIGQSEEPASSSKDIVDEVVVENESSEMMD